MENHTGWEWFVKKFEGLSKIDLTSYKRPQMERRINSFMRSVKASNYKDFIDLLNSDEKIYHQFLQHITINVSEFFRNPNHWEVLEQEILPLLLKGRNSLKIWSAGCSTGEEAYSLAIMAKEKRLNLAGKIMATDIDNKVLSQARAGVYPNKAVEGLPESILRKYFIHQEQTYQVIDELKNLIKFERHNLLRDSFPKDCDLILCRNVVIYFTEEAKENLYRKFAEGLREKGILFIGSTEQIFKAREIGLKSIATFFYQKD